MEKIQQILKTNTGRLLVVSLTYIIVLLVIITITFWLNDGEWLYFGNLLLSPPVYVSFLIGLCLVFISVFRFIVLFVPIFFLSIGIFLITTSVKDNGELSSLGQYIVGHYHIGLFATGTTVAALGIAFLALFLSRLKFREKVSDRLEKELDVCKSKAAELESAMSRLNGRIENLDKDIKNEAKENDDRV